MKRIKDTFRDGSTFKPLLLSILITGLSYGLYKGMLDNFLVEVVLMGEMDRGVTEFSHEILGILLIFIMAIFFMMSTETMHKARAVIMLASIGIHAVLPATQVMATVAICIYSLGEHIQLAMKNSLSLDYAKRTREARLWACRMWRHR